ncbi:hypothetical protein HDV05_007931 [Chytridiales sp. JEL 0842]|nr:hypothetical protein HDV05_007931 [Chytridiales sp. JEL 0842]
MSKVPALERIVKLDRSNNVYNPFLISPSPSRGKPWTLPPFSDVLSQYPFLNVSQPLTTNGSTTFTGLGCFISPNASLGIPLQSSLTAPPASNCSKGYWCPYVEDLPGRQPSICPPQPECGFARLTTGGRCLPQGIFEPVPCYGGFYCPDPKTMLVCPAGYQCPTGSFEPIKCQFLSSCPEGTLIESHYGLLVIVLVFDLLIAALLLSQRIAELRRAQLPWFAILPTHVQRWFKLLSAGGETTAKTESKKKKKKKENAGDNALESKTSLVSAFKKSFHSTPLDLELKFERLSLTLPNGNRILQGVTGKIVSGRMTAIMGPSGAGKTTFMNVLMGKVNRTGGELTINSVPAEMHEFRKVIGYVPQEDTMLRELTVLENLLYSARIRLSRRPEGGKWTDTEIQEHVWKVIEALGLEKVAHTPIGDELARGISGGQRKRVNIGIELVATPIALFLDEPTSGLDSTSALELAEMLKGVCELGLTVVAVVHQPRVEIFERFDDVLVLTPGGRTAYWGPVEGVQGYFEELGFVFQPNVNCADVLMDIVSGKGPRVEGAEEEMSMDDIVNAWEERMLNMKGVVTTGKALGLGDVEDADSVSSSSSQQSTDVDSTNIEITVEQLATNNPSTTVAVLRTIAKSRTAPFLTQFYLSLSRSFLQQSRFLGALALEWGVALFAGFIMGFAVNIEEPYTGLLQPPYTRLSSASSEWFLGLYSMLVGIAISLSGAPSGVKVFGEEKPVYWRETAAGHSKWAYYLGKTVSVVPRLGISAAHFTCLYYLLARPQFGVGWQFALFAMNFFGVYGMAVIVSLLVRRENAPLLAVIVGLFMAVFCGYGPSLTDAANGKFLWVYEIGVNRWAAESQYDLSKRVYSHLYNLDFANAIFGYGSFYVERNLGMMLMLGVVYRVVGYGLLVGLNRDKQR